ncbi:metallophosphoesterase family protein [Adhaeribacter radiodurans]|uniref:Metallophosphoesterase family protein n=1 Tax=Adhaeribacter radiodurans TaxID=2745197 RepID=A0A7L7L234_9BACT|nr:metallophosphoesterase family protein [Adhaeribacter radiodurans]QMU26519.1 metallophosphoesterase family protein [Adhaeribacter radiodurans]
MRIALFSDIHANLPALEAVLADMDQQNLDAVYCLGDLVGYATWPNEVVAEIRKRRIPTIAGNYDEGVGLGSPNCGCAYKTDGEKDLGQQSIDYTNFVITEKNRNYLRMLPRHLRVVFQDNSEEANKIEMLLVHGSPRKINEYLFEDRPEKSFLRMMEEARADILFFGHTHKPYHRAMPYEHEGQTRYRHAINIGSVGKPKDGDPRSCYVILELIPESNLTTPDSIQVEFVRVAYDVEKAAQAVEASPLPNEFAQMLRTA